MKHTVGMHVIVQLKGTDTFLFLKRSDYKKNNALHRDLPGGGLEFGEQTKGAIIRECIEEIGINLSKSEIKGMDCLGSRSRWTNSEKTKWVTVLFYHITIENANIILSHEHTEYQRITLDTAMELKPRRKIIDEAIKLIETIN